VDKTVKSLVAKEWRIRVRTRPGATTRRWAYVLVLAALVWSPLCSADLTGTWYCDDGGTYYLRQLGGKLFWYGERSAASPGWANVLVGTVRGQDVSGHWVDVPKGRTGNKGEIRLRVSAGGNGLEATSKTGGFGGSHWTRAGRMQAAIDRPGQDYRSFDLDSATPALCEKACAQEARCRAWTYVKPGVQGSKARCWLKKGVPPAKRDGCCISGVK
jgi:hypothetical protein